MDPKGLQTKDSPKSDYKAERMDKGIDVEMLVLRQKIADVLGTDHLTGLMNRLHFNKKIKESVDLAKRTGNDLSLLWIDLDHFKGVNDAKGHGAGDEVLKAVAEIIKKSLPRTTDTSARTGGDEFAVILDDTDENGAKN